MPPIPRYKLAVVVWIAIYPTITLIQWLVGPALATVPLPLRTFLLTIVLVPLMVFVLIPVLTRALGFWLTPNPP